MYKIATLNKISPVGLNKLTDDYTMVDDPLEANGIIVRSQNMHDMEFGKDLLAIARAGAGVNNIPLSECSKQGIVVFNSPGANANAVKELVLSGLLMAARNIPEAIDWSKRSAQMCSRQLKRERNNSLEVNSEARSSESSVSVLSAYL